jgi:hypothetical protein
MPIRFRCAYCNQLMGIARRKAGTVVSCPTCHGQVVVPTPEPPLQPELLPPAAGNAGANVFDQQDFDAGLLNPNPVPLPAAPIEHPPTMPTKPPSAAPGFDVQPILAPPTSLAAGLHSVSIVLTRLQLVLLASGALVLAVLAFGLGFALAKWF